MVAPAFSIRPRVRDEHAASMLVDSINLEVAVALLLPPDDRVPENPTGLVRAVSRRRWLPEPTQPPTSTPLHLLVHERNKRLRITVDESTTRRSNRINAHKGRVPVSDVDECDHGPVSCPCGDPTETVRTDLVPPTLDGPPAVCSDESDHLGVRKRAAPVIGDLVATDVGFPVTRIQCSE